MWSKNPDDYKVLEPYIDDEQLYEKMAYKLVPHGEVLKMCINNTAKILDNAYLRDIKDLGFKVYCYDLKNVVTFRDATFPDKLFKDLNIFDSKEKLLFHNSGLLTKLLGFDVLYERETMMIIDENGTLGSEYLIINPEILGILID